MVYVYTYGMVITTLDLQVSSIQGATLRAPGRVVGEPDCAIVKGSPLKRQRMKPEACTQILQQERHPKKQEEEEEEETETEGAGEAAGAEEDEKEEGEREGQGKEGEEPNTPNHHGPGSKHGPADAATAPNRGTPVGRLP